MNPTQFNKYALTASNVLSTMLGAEEKNYKNEFAFEELVV